MRKQNLVAVVNDELMMVSKGVLTCLMKEEFDAFIEAVSRAVTNYVTSDSRFVAAVGEKVAKMAHFDVLPICHECDECGEQQFAMYVVMTVDNKETDFYYKYTLVANPVIADLENAPLVLYNNDGKSQLMQVFESECSGVTSVKTLKNGCGKGGTDDYVERIFTEILSDTDLKVY